MSARREVSSSGSATARPSIRSAWSSLTAAACELAPELAAAGKQVFLDLKLHDIPNTVERATAQAARLGARFLTVHAYPQTMRAAVAGAKGSGMRILAVTVLTSYDDADLFEACSRFGVVETVRRRAEQALALGVDGLVASAAEAAMVRRTVGDECFSSRPAFGRRARTAGDQKRVATPAEAIRDGADYLVVGRPVTQASDPRAAAEAIVDRNRRRAHLIGRQGALRCQSCR